MTQALRLSTMIRSTRKSSLALAFPFFLGLATTPFGVTVAKAAEAPSVTIQGNGPGWITVNYYHTGTGEVLWYVIERQGGGTTTMYSPKGQFTFANLTPDTAYAFQACAVYEGEEEPVCSGYSTARTLPAPGKPANFAPPTITNFDASEHAIKVTWGPTGDYTKVLVRLSDTLGNVDQRDVPNVPNAQSGSFMFPGMRSGERYRIVLKGCSKSLLGNTCGAWSPDVFITTALPPEEQPPPQPPPSKPTLKVTGTSATTVLLEFAVMVAQVNGDDRFLVYRDKTQVQEVVAHGVQGGLAGSFTDTVRSWDQYQHGYRICFEGHSPKARTCSATVLGPEPSVKIEKKPDGIDLGYRETAPDITPNRRGAATMLSSSANCKSGFVTRVARPEDLVCVTPAARSRTTRDNAEAPNHIDPAGAYGPNTCISGYVWRNAFDGDAVCVTPATRALVNEENRLDSTRRAN